MDNLRSAHSQENAYIRFVNLTDKNIDIIWIDFSGNYIKYKTFSRHQYLDINTFIGHPWIFWETSTKDSMCADGNEIFYPQQTICPTTKKLARKCIGIHLPIYTLKMRSLLAVRDYLKQNVNIDELQLPSSLKDELKFIIDRQKKRNVF